MDPETDRGVFSTTDHGQVEEGTKYIYFSGWKMLHLG